MKELKKNFQKLFLLSINEDVMVDLNYRVDELKEKPKDVAKEFLVQHQLIKE